MARNRLARPRASHLTADKHRSVSVSRQRVRDAQVDAQMAQATTHLPAKQNGLCRLVHWSVGPPAVDTANPRENSLPSLRLSKEPRDSDRERPRSRRRPAAHRHQHDISAQPQLPATHPANKRHPKPQPTSNSATSRGFLVVGPMNKAHKTNNNRADDFANSPVKPRESRNLKRALR